MNEPSSESFAAARVTYTVELNGRLIVIENVPARVSKLTGEQFFSPDTVEQIERIVKGTRPPARTVSATIFEFAA